VAAVAVIAALGLVAFAVLPSASIELSPWSTTIGPLTLNVVADPAVTAPDATALTVPARLFRLPVSVTRTFPATGVKVTETKATGTVTFSNFDTGRGVLISKGALVRTESGIEFTTVAELTLPKATFDFFPPFAVHPSTGSVGVEAVEAGTAGNVGNNTITVIPKAKNTLHVTNPEATAGGSHTESPAVSQEDVDNALATLNAALPAELDSQIAKAPDVPSGMALYPATAQLGDASPTVDPKTLVGKVGADFELGLTAEGTVLGVDASPVQTVAAERLRARVLPDWALDPASIHVDVGTPTIVGSVVTFPVTASASQVRTVDGPALLAQVKGLDLPAARGRLDDYGEVRISVWPDWVTTIPNSDRATLVVGDPVPENSPGP
jgi:baseplate J-like protein